MQQTPTLQFVLRQCSTGGGSIAVLHHVWCKPGAALDYLLEQQKANKTMQTVRTSTVYCIL
jgi:hypothetical protein